jgi:transposase InsO family protein
MRHLLNAQGTAVGDAPLFLCGPTEGDGSIAVATSPLNLATIPLLLAAESNFVHGSRSVWVYFPQGLLRHPMAESNGYRDFVASTPQFLPHQCQGVTSMHEISEAVPYPGHSLFQESFFFCTIKNVRDDTGVGDIYVETVVDGNSRMAFAKVYSAQTAMNAVDLLKTRVLPFFERYGIAIERIFTRKGDEYCGLAPVHPFETFLATSHIQHSQVDPSSQKTNSLCEHFFHVLQRGFFTPALRKRFQQSIEMLQQDLDAFLENYNSRRTGFGPDAQDRPPLRVFLDAAGS